MGRSIRGIALGMSIVFVTICLACPLTVLLTHAGLLTPPLIDVTLGPIKLTIQGETIYSSRDPLRTFYSAWMFIEPRKAYHLLRIEVPNANRPLPWRSCQVRVRRAIIAYCTPPPRNR